MARREGWMDNLAAALMGSRPMRKRSTTMMVFFYKQFFLLQVKHKEEKKLHGTNWKRKRINRNKSINEKKTKTKIANLHTYVTVITNIN